MLAQNNVPSLDSGRCEKTLFDNLMTMDELMAMYMKRGGGDIWQLMKFLGHSEITTTMRYAHLSSDIKRLPSFDLAK